MKIEDRFDLSAAPDRVWVVLNDVELIAPFVPGFRLQEAGGDVFRGTMKVKLGAMVVQYDTEITVAERDESSRRVRMQVAGRELGGAGRMQAAVTSQLEAAGTGTAITLETELELVGRVAQMGRSMIADVSASLLRDFVDALEANVLSIPPENGRPRPVNPTSDSNAPMGSRATSDEGAVDLTRAAGRAVARRLAPVALAALALLWLAQRRIRGHRETR